MLDIIFAICISISFSYGNCSAINEIKMSLCVFIWWKFCFASDSFVFCWFECFYLTFLSGFLCDNLKVFFCIFLMITKREWKSDDFKMVSYASVIRFMLVNRKTRVLNIKKKPTNNRTMSMPKNCSHRKIKTMVFFIQFFFLLLFFCWRSTFFTKK